MIATPDVRSVELEFATFSTGAHVRDGEVEFDQGEVSSFSAEGMKCETKSPSADYATPTGRFRTVVTCAARIEGQRWRGAWTLNLRNKT
jgi:hypothetical protein